MPAIELVGGIVTAPSTTETVLTAMSGNSFTVRAAANDAKNFLITAWALSQTAGFFGIKSPLMHDNVKGFRGTTIAAKPWMLLNPRFMQPIFPQDTLVVSLSGSGTGGDIEQGFILNFYDSLPGASANLANASDVLAKMINVLTVPVTCATGTAGGWSGAVALNSTVDLMKANTNYALLGYWSTTLGGAFRIYGTDTAGMGIGGPLDNTELEQTVDYFVRMSELTGLPTVPIINSANKSNTYIDAAVDENGTDQVIYLIFGELSGS